MDGCGLGVWTVEHMDGPTDGPVLSNFYCQLNSRSGSISFYRSNLFYDTDIRANYEIFSLSGSETSS